MAQPERTPRSCGDVPAEITARPEGPAAGERGGAAPARPAAEKAGPAAGSPPTSRRVDRRVVRSRRAIVEAFERLIMVMPLEDVTVSAIAREADVDRKTFYQHFGSVDGLLVSISEDVVTELLDEVEAVMSAVEGPEDGSRIIERFFSALTDHMNQNLLLQQRYCEHVPSELLLEHVLRALMRQIVDRGLVSGAVPDEEMEMTLSFGLGGLISLYRWWLTSDRSVPVEEVMRRASQLAEHGMVSLLWRWHGGEGSSERAGDQALAGHPPA